MQDLAQMLGILFLNQRIHQYVVNKYDDELIKIKLKHLIHQSHEDGGGISHSEWHNQELEVSVSDSKSRLRYVSLSHTQLVMPQTQVNF